jgi:large subunit ribosomal protein L28
MSYVCDNCAKKTVHGNSQHHRRGVAGKRWLKRAQVTPRLFKPNLQKATVVISGEKIQMKLCSRCIKRFKKDGKIAAYTKLAFA